MDALNRHWFVPTKVLQHSLFEEDAYSYSTMEDYTISFNAMKFLGVRTYSICPSNAGQLVVLNEASTCSSTNYLSMNEFRQAMIDRLLFGGYTPVAHRQAQFLGLATELLVQPFAPEERREEALVLVGKELNSQGFRAGIPGRAYVSVAASEAEFEACVSPPHRSYCVKNYGKHAYSDLVSGLHEIMLSIKPTRVLTLCRVNSRVNEAQRVAYFLGLKDGVNQY